MVLRKILSTVPVASDKMSSHPGVIEKRRRRYPWTSELDLLLEQGYRAGLVGQRAVIDWIQRCTGWPRQACWDRARKLGLARKRSVSPRQWTPIEEQRLLNLAGSKNVRFIAERLHRSVAAVRKRLRRLGETSTRVREGLTKNQLAELIGSSPKTIQRWIDLGWLHGGYEGKNRDDDSIRISDKQFFEFWQNHPEQVLSSTQAIARSSLRSAESGWHLVAKELLTSQGIGAGGLPTSERMKVG